MANRDPYRMSNTIDRSTGVTTHPLTTAMPKVGDVVPSHFNTAIVVASYFASLCGCLLTVELLHRRGTGVRNLRSWLETAGCAITLGLIGIWCMHFIGNRAIILGDGDHQIQLVYSPGYITLSAFLPIIGLSIAFAAAEFPVRSPRLHWVALTCTGTFAGLSVVGMHYIGNFGISNYKLKYVPRFLAASIIVAIGDCLAVLILFYTWREKWISDWWKRLLCAIFLAGGVSAMHFTASTHCIYHLKHYNAPKGIRSRNVQVIIAGILGGTAGVICVCVLLFTRHRSRVLKRSSQKIMLACAMFDKDGRILVTTEGVLPSREITDKYNHRTFNEEFDTAHPVFQWIFRVTRNWAVVSELIPKMKSHLGAYREDSEENSRPSSSASSAQYDPGTYNDYSIVFRERFCTAAASLALSMHLPVHRIGVLYDKIIETGTLQPEDKVWKRSTISELSSNEDIETGVQHMLFGKGQLLFLTRRLSADSTDRFLNAGFRFASVQQVGRNIAETMQIPPTALEVHMTNIKHYIENLSTLQKPGTWLGCFAILPKPNSKGGFDVAVKKTEQEQLPDVQLLASEPSQWQVAFLERMNEMPMTACMTYLEDRQRRDSARTPHEQQFANLVLNTVVRLGQQIPASWFTSARFYGKPVHVHYSQAINGKAPLTTLFAFVVCTDLHTTTEACDGITRVPLSFFNARQQTYAGSPNHAIMLRDIHQEFAPLLTRKTPKMAESRVKKLSIHMPRSANRKVTRTQSRRASTIRPTSEDNADSSSDTYELVDKPQHLNEFTQDTTTEAARHDNWGGILVNSETVVKSDSKSEFSNGSQGNGLGLKTAVSTATPEETFVDELFAFARSTIPSKFGGR